jgi:hypothetical protein
MSEKNTTEKLKNEENKTEEKEIIKTTICKKIENLDDFSDEVEKLYSTDNTVKFNNKSKMRYVMKYKHKSGKLEFTASNNKTVISIIKKRF